MDSTSHATKFGGTWEQIVDRFLYCASSSETTRGSNAITEANLPSYTHTFSGTNVTDSLMFRRVVISGSDTQKLFGTMGSSNPVFTIRVKFNFIFMGSVCQ